MKLMKSILMTLLLSSLLMGAASCDNNLVYEKEGDCTPKVQFVFKKHRQALRSIQGRETDAFDSSVGTVHLFVYDAETGELVFDKSERTENLQSAIDLKIGSGADQCFMPVDLKPGRYRMVAWCGLDENDHNNAFYLNDDLTRAGYSHCSVKLGDLRNRPVNNEKYDDLYHGRVHEVEVTLAGDGQIIPIELTKNTNDIAVWVQHTSLTFGRDDYEVVYVDANGTMHFDDNSMAVPDRLEYHPHTKTVLSSSTEYNGETVEAGALVAHISTARLMEGHKEDARLEVRDKEGKTVFSIPFIKYLLEMQTFTSDGQFYLDCEDTYNCSFYLTGEGEDGLWMPARIIINNWVLVPNQNSQI